MKSFLRAKYASKSTIRRIERIVRQGERATRRSFVAAKRRQLLEGGLSSG
jgi:hypothetical protein